MNPLEVECAVIAVIAALVVSNMATFIFYKRNWRPPARLSRFGDRE